MGVLPLLVKIGEHLLGRRLVEMGLLHIMIPALLPVAVCLQVGVDIKKQGQGGAYMDITPVYNNHYLLFEAESNFLGVELVSPLDEGRKYNVEFYLSLYDSCRYACRDVGVHFSLGRPSNITDTLVNMTPQIVYEGDYLTDKEDWMRISGSFIAEGGENYMTIGNFKPYQESDTMNLNSGGVFPTIPYWELASYFIDDVSVVQDTTWHVGVDENLSRNVEFSLYPNPNKGNFQVSLRLPQLLNTTLELLDISGRSVLNQSVENQSTSIDAAYLSAGVYSLVLKQNGIPIARSKLVIQH